MVTKNIFVILILLGVVFFIVIFIHSGSIQHQINCVRVGGRWVEIRKGCLGVNQKTCQDINGKLKSVGSSSCYEDPKATLCTADFISSCEF